MGKVIVYENPADTSEFVQYEHSGPVIDFLTRYFPAGFGGRQHVCVFNTVKLEVKDYDRVVDEGDVVAFVVIPAEFITWAFIGRAIVSFIIAQVLNYAINKFFGPKGTKPTSPAMLGRGELPAASSTYSLTAPANAVRLGQPIPVPYGRNLIVPDIASQPYSWFSNNDNYVGMILCIGQGEYDIHSVFVGNSPVNQLASGVVSYTVFNPAAHQSTFGIIAAATGIQENVYTSPEVSDQELDALPSDGGSLVYYANTTTYNVYPLTPIPEGREDPGAYVVFTNVGSIFDSLIRKFQDDVPIWLIVNAGSSANNGTFPVTYINEVTTYEEIPVPPPIGWEGPWTEVQQVWTYKLVVCVTTDEISGLWAVPEELVLAGLTSTPPGVSDTPPGIPVGPFSASPPEIKSTWLEYDIVFPNGCYGQNDESGEIEWFAVSVAFVAEEIDDDGVVIGPKLRLDRQYNLGTTTAQRITISHTVPYGRYRVTGYRTTPKAAKASSQSNLHWVNLKAYATLGNPFPPYCTYGDVTLIALKAKATNGLASDALSKFSVDCTRKLDGTVTRNPIDALADIITNSTYGGKRPTTEIDWTKFNELKTEWLTDYFDAVFDTSTNLWDAMGMAVQVQHTAPTMSGSLITLVEDKLHTVPQFSLNEEQIKELTLTFIFPDGNEVDGVEGEYRDPKDNAQLFAIYPADSVNPEQVTIWGCRNYSTALAYVTQRWNQLRLRRLLVKMKVELYGHVIPVGSTVLITHRNLRDALGNNDGVLCVVQSVTADDEFTLTLDAHRHEPGVYP